MIICFYLFLCLYVSEIDTSEKKRNILRNEQRNLKNNENKLEYDISSANEMIKKCEHSIKQEKNKVKLKNQSISNPYLIS